MDLVPFADRERSGSDGSFERGFFGYVITFDIAVVKGCPSGFPPQRSHMWQVPCRFLT
jgi:hypothetical protein